MWLERRTCTFWQSSSRPPKIVGWRFERLQDIYMEAVFFWLLLTRFYTPKRGTIMKQKILHVPTDTLSHFPSEQESYYLTVCLVLFGFLLRKSYFTCKASRSMLDRMIIINASYSPFSPVFSWLISNKIKRKPKERTSAQTSLGTTWKKDDVNKTQIVV